MTGTWSAFLKISRLLLIAAVAAVIGLSVFGALVWNAVNVEPASTSEAAARFASLHVEIEALTASDDTSHLCLAVYTPEHERLAEAEVPLWFVALKAPAIDLVAERAGIDELGIMAAQLLDEPPGLILDEQRGEQRVLVWLR